MRRLIFCASTVARHFQPSCTKWPITTPKSYAQVAVRPMAANLRRQPRRLWVRDRSKGPIRAFRFSARSANCTGRPLDDFGARIVIFIDAEAKGGGELTAHS